jgi:hypothetical protein
MKQKLHKELQALLDFYHQQRKNLPEAFSHRSGVINNPSFFKVSDLQHHLNNPLLQPEWVHVKLAGNASNWKRPVFIKPCRLDN